MIYIGIILAKIVEITLATVRIVLITKGERKVGSIIAFFEVTLWILIVSQVLQDIASDPFKIVAYATGFAIGNYLGSIAEEKLGIGTTEIECIVKEDGGRELVDKLRQYGYAVTVIHAEGMDSAKLVLKIYIQRKKTQALVGLIKEINCSSVITITDRKPIAGGFGMLIK